MLLFKLKKISKMFVLLDFAFVFYYIKNRNYASIKMKLHWGFENILIIPKNISFSWNEHLQL